MSTVVEFEMAVNGGIDGDMLSFSLSAKFGGGQLPYNDCRELMDEPRKNLLYGVIRPVEYSLFDSSC
jgi:hypothetical protein